MSDRAEAMVRYARFVDRYYTWDIYDANDTDMDNITFIVTVNSPQMAIEHLEEIIDTEDWNAEETAEINGILEDLRKAC